MDDLPRFRFWLKTCGFILAGGIVLFIVLELFTRAWYAWGTLIAFGLLVAAVLVPIWIRDRREIRRYEDDA